MLQMIARDTRYDDAMRLSRGIMPRRGTRRWRDYDYYVMSSLRYDVTLSGCRSVAGMSGERSPDTGETLPASQLPLAVVSLYRYVTRSPYEHAITIRYHWLAITIRHVIRDVVTTRNCYELCLRHCHEDVVAVASARRRLYAYYVIASLADIMTLPSRSE